MSTIQPSISLRCFTTRIRVKYGCNAEPIREIINGRIFSMIVTHSVGSFSFTRRFLIVQISIHMDVSKNIRSNASLGWGILRTPAPMQVPMTKPKIINATFNLVLSKIIPRTRGLARSRNRFISLPPLVLLALFPLSFLLRYKYHLTHQGKGIEKSLLPLSIIMIPYNKASNTSPRRYMSRPVRVSGFSPLTLFCHTSVCHHVSRITM